MTSDEVMSVADYITELHSRMQSAESETSKLALELEEARESCALLATENSWLNHLLDKGGSSRKPFDRP